MTMIAPEPRRPRPREGHLGARPNLHTLAIDPYRYRAWWIKTYGAEAIEIANAFVADITWMEEPH